VKNLCILSVFTALVTISGCATLETGPEIDPSYSRYMGCMKEMAESLKSSGSEVVELADAADVRCHMWFGHYERALMKYFDSRDTAPSLVRLRVKQEAEEGRFGAKKAVIQIIVESRLPASPTSLNRLR